MRLVALTVRVKRRLPFRALARPIKSGRGFTPHEHAPTDRRARAPPPAWSGSAVKGLRGERPSEDAPQSVCNPLNEVWVAIRRRECVPNDRARGRKPTARERARRARSTAQRRKKPQGFLVRRRPIKQTRNGRCADKVGAPNSVCARIHMHLILCA